MFIFSLFCAVVYVQSFEGKGCSFVVGGLCRRVRGLCSYEVCYSYNDRVLRPGDYQRAGVN